VQTEAQIRQLLLIHTPANAVDYCAALWLRYPFYLKLAGSRTTKAGDFAVKNNRMVVTVNRDLNPFLFLVTLIHEIAHVRVYQQYRHTCTPHGREWKLAFGQLMAPLLHAGCFPPDLSILLHRHLQNPAASSFSDLPLTRCFRKYDQKPDGLVPLADVPANSLFRLQRRWFVKGPARRTRFACRCVRSRRIYLVPGQALVFVAQTPLFI
jgi:hypothetical protein